MSQEDTTDRFAATLQRECLGVRVGRLNRLIARRYEAALRPLNLSTAQLEVLSALTLCREPVRPADLCTWLAVERSTMSRNLALMAERGYVVSTDTSPTGRLQRVTISAHGRHVLASAEAVWTDVQDQIAHRLGPEAVGTLDAWLDQLGTGRNA